MNIPLKVGAAVLIGSLVSACSGGGSPSFPKTAQMTQELPSHRVIEGRTAKQIMFNTDLAAAEHSQRHLQRLASANNMVYWGGPIQKVPKIYLIFWGQTYATDTAADPDGQASYFIRYVNGIGGSPWLNIDSQYNGTGQGFITNPPGQLLGTWYDPSPVPPTPVDADIANEAVKSISHGFPYSADANYVVVTPTHHNESGFAVQWCAWHSNTTSAYGPVAFTLMPHMTDAGASCGQYSVNPAPGGNLDGVSIVGGHEISETATDPQLNAWYDNRGAEIGDKCAWVGLTNITFSTGTFPVQPLWSNAVAACATSWGSTPTPTPSPSPTRTPTPTPSPSPTQTPTPTPSPTRTPTPTPSPTRTPTPTPSPTRAPSPTPTPCTNGNCQN